uniref:Uncharacterized protein n=1 Tax=Romanomermis culicivorax TaxID=13658 RepID=A0A915JYS4_ROMCU
LQHQIVRKSSLRVYTIFGKKDTLQHEKCIFATLHNCCKLTTTKTLTFTFADGEFDVDVRA